ncbi:hypothetical protein ABEF95_014363 [Exophiala dermatitidis]
MSKKRKRDQDEPRALPESFETDAPTQADDAGQDSQTKKEERKGAARQARSERRSKKVKKSKEQSSQTTSGTTALSPDEKPSAHSDKEAQPTDHNQAVVDEDSSDKIHRKAKKSKKVDGDHKETSESAARFIVFVGNLPFSATAAQVKDHFSKLAPSSVRLSTDKATGKGKGFAFVEFDSYDKMKTCLKLYHHSIFEPNAKSEDGEPRREASNSKKKGRRINVELTAGGGGAKSQDRLMKIKTKNEKLNEERKRQLIKDKSDQKKAASKAKAAPGTGANATEASDAAQDDRGAIHPSRLARVQH